MRRWMKWLSRLLALLLAAAICAAGIVALLGWRMYRQALADKPLEDALEEVRAKPNYTPLDQLPQLYLDAVVAAEDQRFYRHPGFDMLAIGRALWNDLRAGAMVEGGSTITQQLAKNLYFTQEKHILRKAAELFMALELERVCTKEEILELYVNSIYFGQGYNCVYDASQGYFGKPPGEMTDAECTLLAGIPNAPSVYNPVHSPELARARQAQVLEQMVVQGRLTQAQADVMVWTH